MKTYLVVETGYEYNDQGYDVQEGYEVKQGFTDKGKAQDLADKLNIETTRNMGEYFQDDDGDQIIPWKVIEVEVETGRELTDVKKARTKVLAALEEARKIAKDAFASVSQEVFDAHPILTSFAWQQYTPYFNDGDTCEFSANTDYPTITFADGETDEESGTYGFDKKKSLTEKEQAVAAVHEFLAAFDDDDFESMFGDHMEVTVNRGTKKIEIEVTEYSHD